MTPFSEKQMQVLCWWGEKSPHRNKLAVICDGAVRSGKTTCMGISFFLWAMARFQNTSFAVCGKTIRSVRRNVVAELIPKLKSMGFSMRVRQAENEIILSYQGRENRFYLFGGRDESSAALIQGMTLGGVLFDEVALMPRSFVEQGIARCSLKNAKLWFNCNPEHPQHWFYREWILKAESRNALYLHFTMEDNPSLSEDVRKRYRTMFSGAFYSRFIEGKWTAAKNDVLNGIRMTATALRTGQIKVTKGCVDAVREFSLYRWADDGARDVPVKENDHAMDDIRYFVSTVLGAGESFACAVQRETGKGVSIWDF